MVAYLKNAPAGVPGDVTRPLNTVVEPILLGDDFAAFGVPYKLDGTSGKAMPIESGDTAADFQGIIARSVPSQGGDDSEGFNNAIPNVDQPNGGVVSGYVNVICTTGTPVKGQPVFMRVTAVDPEFYGSLETSADGGDCVELEGVQWSVNGKDANNITEIRIGR